MPNTVMITKLLAALPREFDFYHLGKVKLQEAALAVPLDRFPAAFPIVSEDQSPAIGYSFRGDVSGVLILNVPGGADASVYAEMGNVIASMVATRLANDEQLDVMISEPSFLSSSALRKLVGATPALESRTYLHHHGSGSIPVSAWIVAAARTEHV
jgi:hypothetical protein